MTDPRWARIVDALADAMVLGIAAFTLVYEIALLGQDLAATTVLALGTCLALPGAVLAVRRGLRRETPTPGPPDGTDDVATSGTPLPPVALAVLGLAIAGSVALAALVPLNDAFFWPAGALLVLVLGVPLLVWLPRTTTADQPAPEGGRPAGEHAVAVLLCGAAAAWSLLLVRPDADDVYYLNRSVWVAAHDTVPVKDTLFGPEVFHSIYGGSNQINSVETLYGALARVAGLEAATITWLVAAPAFSAVALWALWRLARAWAPSAALGVHVVGAVVLFLSADTRMGDLGVPRMGQGKSVALLVVIPLIWVWTTRWLERRDRWSAGMLLAAGTAFTGLTTSAVVLVPAIAAAVVVGSGVARRLRPGLVAAGLLLAFPLTMGVLVTLSGDDVGDTSYELLPSGREFLATFSDSPIVLAVTVLGFATGWFFTRSSVTRALACAAALCCFLALLPPLRGLAHALTATGPVLWRWQLLVPLPVLVGLAAVGLGRLLVQRVGRLRTRPFLQVLPASLVVVAMVLAGDTANGKADTAWQGRPGWDVRPDSLRAARAALALPAPPGTVLLPDAVSMTLAKTSADRFTVSARPNYTAAMASQPGFDATARAGLERFVRSGRANSDAPAARIPTLLNELDVATVCFRRLRPGTPAIVEEAGFRAVRVPDDTGLARCYVRSD